MTSAEKNYNPALEALETFRTARSGDLDVKDKETLDEIAHRLRRLQGQFERLMALNEVQVQKSVPQVKFDQDTDTITFRHGEIEKKMVLKRADPDVPIAVKGLTSGGAYKAGTESDEDERTLQLEFESLLEAYYYSAHRVLKLVRRLRGFKGFKCRAVTIVRNKLIDHAEHGEIYSFGFGSSGPRVRPMQRPGGQWHDEGLLPNTEAFVDNLVQAFKAESG